MEQDVSFYYPCDIIAYDFANGAIPHERSRIALEGGMRA